MQTSRETHGPLIIEHSRFDTGDGFPVHYHSHDHGLLVVSGRLQIEVGGRNWTYGPGEFATMRARVRHEVRALEPTEIVAVRAASEEGVPSDGNLAPPER